MKKSILHITSILLAFTVLFSTFSFTIAMHYCGDNLVDAAVLSSVKGCGMEKRSTSTATPIERCTITKKDCCSDQKINVVGQNELKITDSIFDLNQQIFFTSFLYSYIKILKKLPVKVNFFRNYASPPILKYIYKLDESYLI